MAEQAVFTREEVEQLLIDQRIALDQRVHYAIAFLAGLRHGEISALRWRHWDTTAVPLGRLMVAKSYSTEKRRMKGTKTDTVRYVPVHPVLAHVFASWRASGWRALTGRELGPDDLICRCHPRTSRVGGR